MRPSLIVFAALVVGVATAPRGAVGQDPARSTDPIVGLRDLSPQVTALENIDIVVRPGRRIDGGTILIKEGSIVAAGRDVEIPAGAERLDRKGHVAYAGLIDAYSEVEVPDPSGDSGAPHWNGNIMPQRSAATVAASSVFDGKKLRSQGITVRLLAPDGGIVKGTSCIVLVDDGPSGKILVSDAAFQHLALTVPRRRGGGGRDSYPNSPMGAVALLRQSLLDADWYTRASAAYRADGTLPKPDRDVALESLATAMRDMQFIVDAPNERMAERAGAMAKEFRLDIIVRGSGREYRRIDRIAQLGYPMLIPVDFPDAPNISNASDARDTSLEDLMAWELAPSNPARLADAGIAFCLTTDGLASPDKFLTQVRKAVAAGLADDQALAAVTTNPANLLGISDWTGTVEAGKLANLVVTDGELFDDKTKTIETWVAGRQYRVTPEANSAVESIAGNWKLTGNFEADGQESDTLLLTLKKKGSSLSGTVQEQADEADEADNDTEDEDDEEDEDEEEADDEEEAESVELEKVVRERDRLSAAIDLGKVDDDFPAGISWLTLLTIDGDQGLEIVSATVSLPSGKILELQVTAAPEDADESDQDPNATDEDAAADADADAKASDEEKSDEEASDDKNPDDEPVDEALTDDKPDDPTSEDDPAEKDAAAEEKESEEKESEEKKSEQDPAKDDSAKDDSDDDQDSDRPASGDDSPPVEVVYPLGAYGTDALPPQPASVLFRGATVWTCAEQGILEQADVLVVEGIIRGVGTDLEVPADCQIVDVQGKHLTPGLIDCHSHMATDGGVNESGQTITAEVRIGDFIDNSDISIYRQLAGGLTSSNILHGSANPIGGQNQVIKLRWGGTMDQMLFRDAPRGIKFALGENVKRTRGRYPDTRMGVEQIIRDQFLAAQEYAAAHQQYQAGDRSTLPPRRDLQLEAIAEILAGDRWIHCHSYRQDEIFALLDTLDEFGVQIGSLQHILEGYKVADRMLEHGATASSFSDWWAYKFEVYDAIPYNGAIMYDVGIVVSFNSDDAELARHMNTEAAKAVKYGGVSPEEALKFVTLNPAKQLRIDDRVGSIEVGKDADLAVWSRQPLSTMTRCEQTWIDGRCYFSLEKDSQLRKRDAELHSHLVQKIIGGGTDRSGARKPRVEEEDRWHRHDIYCQHHDHADAEDHAADHQLETDHLEAGE
jgi:N-acetylglucosamine-6-phosphate deacetylase